MAMVFFLVLLSFTDFQWALQGFYWVLLGFTGFQLVGMGFAGFY